MASLGSSTKLNDVDDEIRLEPLRLLTGMVISKFPPGPKIASSQLLATTVYIPLARTAALIEKLGFGVSWIPLSCYRDKSFYTMRTDSRDRFGTPLAQRLSRAEIERMMVSAGLSRIEFSETEPYWCAVGRKI